MAANATQAIRWLRDDDGVVLLTLDDPDHSANRMSVAFADALAATVERIEAETADIAGVVVTSAKPTFFAGGDLDQIAAVTEANVAEFEAFVRRTKAALRRLETCGRPVVAAINGAALGGGFEICLACHRRVIVDRPDVVVGFPEVTLGLLAGGGGIVRSSRLVGVEPALAHWLLEGQRHDARRALELGLVDEVVEVADDLLPAARRWIAADPSATQAWDRAGYAIPGGVPTSTDVIRRSTAFGHRARRQLDGGRYPAPAAIVAAAVEGAQTDVKSAFEIETQHFLGLAVHPVAKRLIAATFFDRQAVRALHTRSAGVTRFRVEKAVVLGAGPTAAGLAAVCARSGIDVTTTDRIADARRADLVIDASVADAPNASAELRVDAADVVTLQLCCPWGQLSLVEVICGNATGSPAVERAVDVAHQLRQTTIVVRGEHGPFSSCLAAAATGEAAAMLDEGIGPHVVEQIAERTGFSTAVLRVADSNPAAGVRAAGRELQELEERLLFRVAIETVRCLERGVLDTVLEANVGSILGAGFPDWTGGAVAYVDDFRRGAADFVARADELAERHGDRFAPPASLRSCAIRGGRYGDLVPVDG